MAAEPLSNAELSPPKIPDTINAQDCTSEPQSTAPQDAQIHEVNSDVVPAEKRKREDGDGDAATDRSLHPLWKTSLCSYFRRGDGSCSHGDSCRYAHGEEELRPRPDNTWDPTSERAKKALKTETGEKRDVTEGIMITEAFVDDEVDGGDGFASNHALSKCLVHLPGKWNSEKLRKFLNDEASFFCVFDFSLSLLTFSIA